MDGASPSIDRFRFQGVGLVGAHALLQCDALITYETVFHRDFFKGLKLIVPKA